MRRWKGYQKGINLGGWLSQCSHTKENYETYITESDIEKIASWGLDHVRLPIDYEMAATKGGAFKEEGFSYIDKCINWCRKYGLNLVLDLHKTAGYCFDENVGDITFFESRLLQEQFYQLWEEIAKRYGKYSDFVAFELLNEVVDKSVIKQWNDIILCAIERIRYFAPKTVLVVGGVSYNSVTSIKFLPKPYDKNIVYNFHCYEPMLFTHQAAHWMKEMTADFYMQYPCSLEQMKQKTLEVLGDERGEIFAVEDLYTLGSDFFEKIFREALVFSQKCDVPLYCGEYGVIDRAPLDGTLQWFKDIHTVLEKYQIGRAVWNYKGKDFGISDTHYDAIREKLIQFL